MSFGKLYSYPVCLPIRQFTPPPLRALPMIHSYHKRKYRKSHY